MFRCWRLARDRRRAGQRTNDTIVARLAGDDARCLGARRDQQLCEEPEDLGAQDPDETIDVAIELGYEIGDPSAERSLEVGGELVRGDGRLRLAMHRLAEDQAPDGFFTGGRLADEGDEPDEALRRGAVA